MSTEDTRRVLDLLSQGKITVDEADRLLAAIGQAPRERATAGAGAPAGGKGTATAEAPLPRYLRITVTRTRGWHHDERAHARRAWMWPGYAGGREREITVRVPFTLVRNGMRLGAMIPGLTREGLRAHLRERGVDVDLSRLDADTIARMVSEFGEMNIDIESDRGGKARIRITCE